MEDGSPITPGSLALEEALDAVRELHGSCCQPLRSPRMEALTASIEDARQRLGRLDDDAGEAGALIGILEDAGAQLGHLQVACCAPARTKLYATALDCLGRTQRLVSRHFGLDH